MLYQTEGIVLSVNDLGEHDRAARIFTKEEGLVQAVVKGARKPKSRLAAVTQPFSRATLQLFRGRSLDRVTQVDLMTSHPGIMLDYRKMVYASYLSEVVSQIVPEREPNPSMYDFFAAALAELERRDDPWPVAAWGELGIVGRAGFAPSFGRCAVCGAVPEAGVFFLPDAGGVICDQCRASGAFEGAVAVSPGTARTLDILSGSSGPEGSCPRIAAVGRVKEEARSVLSAYTAHVLGKRPKSSSLVESIEVEPRARE